MTKVDMIDKINLLKCLKIKIPRTFIPAHPSASRVTTQIFMPNPWHY